MKLGLITTDSRQHNRTYGLPTPAFGTAPEALLQGFTNMPGLEVHILSCAQKPMKSPDKLAENIWFHSLYVPRIGWMRTSYQGCIRAVRRCLKAVRPDIVHGQGTERECAVSAAFSRFPNVVTIHGNMAELARLFGARMGSFGWLAAQLENIVLGRTAGVFCNSQYTEGLVSPRAKRTWRVPNAIREQFFTTPRHAPAAAKCVLVNVGIITERKRQVELLEVARRLHGQGFEFELHFIGEANAKDPYGAKFLEAMKEAEAKGFARYLGMKSTTELIECYDRAHGLVHFPSEEAFGLVVAEAMTRDLKFFGSRLGGMLDICNGVPGVGLFEAGDWDGLTDAIAAWIRNGQPRANGAASLMSARYHPRVVAQRHVEIYREVLIKPA